MLMAGAQEEGAKLVPGVEWYSHPGGVGFGYRSAVLEQKVLC